MLDEHQRGHHNGIKTVLLFVGIIGVLVGVGWILTQRSGDMTYLVAFSLLGLASTAYSYWNSDKFALKAMGAVPISQAEAPELYAMVADLAQGYRLPLPRLYLAPTEAPNAFATGRNPRNSAVCVTSGVLKLLDADELRGVLAHELSHVANRDGLTASVAAALANVITTVANVLSFGALYGGRGAATRNPIAVLVGAMLAPFAAMVIRMGISRTREFDADADGARLTGEPLALASALTKLEVAIGQVPLRPTRRLEPASALMIANPFGPLALGRLLSSHPPVAERIRRLEQLATELGQAGPATDPSLPPR